MSGVAHVGQFSGAIIPPRGGQFWMTVNNRRPDPDLAKTAYALISYTLINASLMPRCASSQWFSIAASGPAITAGVR